MLLGLVYTQTPQLTGYLYAGREKLDQTTFSGTLVNDQYGYGSPAYDNAGCYTLGASASTCVGEHEHGRGGDGRVLVEVLPGRPGQPAAWAPGGVRAARSLCGLGPEAWGL